MIFRDADTVLVLIDVNDPMTYDKEFVNGIKYSPFCAGGTEICEQNRKAIGQMSENDADIYANKFVIEVFPEKLGDFAAHFLPNECSQRSLTFRTYQREDEDEEFNIEEDMMIAVFEMSSGPALLNMPEDDDEDEDQDSDESDEESEDDDSEVQVYDFTKKHKAKDEVAVELESAVASGRAFSAPSTKVVQ